MELTRKACAARVAALTRSRSTDDPTLLDARRDLWYASLIETIEHRPSGLPALSNEQRTNLADQLREVIA